MLFNVSYLYTYGNSAELNPADFKFWDVLLLQLTIYFLYQGRVSTGALAQEVTRSAIKSLSERLLPLLWAGFT